jgi:hypothetical protein
MFYLIQIFTKFPLMCSKLSLCFVYRNLLTVSDIRTVVISKWVNYTLMVVLTGFFTAATFVVSFACTPVQKSWRQELPGHCVDTEIMFNYVTSAINIATSAVLIIIPMPVLYLAKRKRIEVKQLIALVMLGLVYGSTLPLQWIILNIFSDTVISVVRLYMISGLYDVREDFTCKFEQFYHTQLSLTNSQGSSFLPTS